MTCVVGRSAAGTGHVAEETLPRPELVVRAAKRDAQKRCDTFSNQLEDVDARRNVFSTAPGTPQQPPRDDIPPARLAPKAHFILWVPARFLSFFAPTRKPMHALLRW